MMRLLKFIAICELTLNSVLPSNLLRLSGVKMSELDLAAGFSGDSVRSRLPFGLESLAMAAPRRVEFNQPWIAAFDDL